MFSSNCVGFVIDVSDFLVANLIVCCHIFLGPVIGYLVRFYDPSCIAYLYSDSSCIVFVSFGFQL